MVSTFTHLHVASWFSLGYGTAEPEDLVAVAARHGMRSLALTDRDGLYGAVRFVDACEQAGMEPVLGVDLPLEPIGTPVRSLSSSRSQPTRRNLPRSRSQSLRRSLIVSPSQNRGRARHDSPWPVGPRPSPDDPRSPDGAGAQDHRPRATVLALGSCPEPVTGSPQRSGTPRRPGTAGSSGTTSGQGTPPFPGTAGSPGSGWTGLCRLVTDVRMHDRPVLPELVGEHASASGTPALAVLLGPDSEVGRAVLRRRDDLALRVLAHWQRALPEGGVFVEVVCHDSPPGTPASLGQAARLLALARRARVPAVLTNAVRYPTRDGAVVADLLDAIGHRPGTGPDRFPAGRADLVPGEVMTHLARRIAQAAGDLALADELLRNTAGLAARCRIDGAQDLGLGTRSLPDPRRADPTSHRELRARCEAAVPLRYPGLGSSALRVVTERLEDELAFFETAGYAGYFLMVAEVCQMIRDRSVRVAARGSSVGSLVNHLLGISEVDPVRHDLLLERFVSPLRQDLPDIDLDVESDRRQEIHRAVLDHFGPQRASCLCTHDTYRARQALRDTAAALGIPRGEAAAIAMSFPHLRARRIRAAIAELPELQQLRQYHDRNGNPERNDRHDRNGRGDVRERLFELAERLDGLPRHTSLHPCGIVLSDGGLLDRTPLENGGGLPMSQFGTKDVERLGILKLDLLGNRMQSAMSHALREIVRVDGNQAGNAGGHPPSAPYMCPQTGHIALDAIPWDDPRTFRLIRSTRTIGCFQIESPGQRDLLGRFAPETFADLIMDISLFRPGPLAGDMLTPFLRADTAASPHPCLDAILGPTRGVVLFHEQVLRIISITSGCSLARADRVRRALADERNRQEIHRWWRPAALARGYDEGCIDRVWKMLVAFGAFGFCKAHAAAFAVPTYQSAWLKAHHPAAFLAGVLTHEPGMYPRRLILQEARRTGIAILPLDVNCSTHEYRVERLPGTTGSTVKYGIRLSLSDVKGIRAQDVERIVRGVPYRSLDDFLERAQVPQPLAERLLLAGAFDAIHGLGAVPPARTVDPGEAAPPGSHGPTRRDLLLHLREHRRSPRCTGVAPGQLSLDLAAPGPRPAGLPETTPAELAQDQLEILGLDAHQHVLAEYAPMLRVLGVTPSERFKHLPDGSPLLVCGVRVSERNARTRAGGRILFLTLDDLTGPVDLAFFQDARDRYITTLLSARILLVRGTLRRRGPGGIGVTATEAWDLQALSDTCAAPVPSCRPLYGGSRR